MKASITVTCENDDIHLLMTRLRQIRNHVRVNFYDAKVDGPNERSIMKDDE